LSSRNTTQLILLLSLLLLSCKPDYQANDLISSFEKQNRLFKVRVTVFREDRVFGNALGGAIYLYEVKVNGRDTWEKIMEVQSDDPIPVDENSIIFPNDEVCFVFFLSKYAVTLNGGDHWTAWDLKQTPSFGNDNSCVIDGVKIEKKGNGTMTLRCHNANRIWFTDNFGIGWHE